MGKKCHNCNFEVKESYKGPCPNCKEEKEYSFLKSFEEEINISDTVKIDLKKAGLDPDHILTTSKMLKAKNEEIAAAMRPISNMLRSAETKKLQRQIKAINDIVSYQQKRFSKLNFSVTLPKKDIDELKDIKLNVHKQEENTRSTEVELLKCVQEILEKLEGQHDEQKDMHKKTHDRLSPKQTMGLAFVVGLLASVLGGVIYGFITNLPP